MKKLAIIDTFALLHRAYHAIPNLTTKDGRMVNAAYGFTSILLKLIKEIKPDYIVAAFDLPHETFRKKEYKEYKAQREAPDQDFIDQIDIIEDILEVLDIPKLALPGYEADDVIGSLTAKYSKKDNMEVIIVSGDLDTLQLVNKHARVFTMKRGINDTMYYDVKAVKERYGLKPSQIIDMKALAGDQSDNIPGVKGIGQKGAEALIQEFGSIEKLYQNLSSDKIKPRTKELLTEYKKDAIQSKHLATIITDLKFEFDLEKAHIEHYDNDKVNKLFQELEFRSLINKLPNSNQKSAAPKKVSSKLAYEIIDSETGIKKLAMTLGQQKIFSLDTETTGLNPLKAEILGASFSWQAKQGVYVHTRTDKQRATFKKYIKPILENEKIKKIGHNIKFDAQILYQLGIKLENYYFDTLVAAYLLHPERSLKLEELVYSYLGIKMQTLKELIEVTLGEKLAKKKDLPITDVPEKELAAYGAEDADMTFRLYKKLKSAIEKNKFNKLLTDVEMPLVPILTQMETDGILINVPYLQKMEKELNKDVQNLEKKIHKLAGMEFNIASPLQLKEVLFEKLEIDTKGIKRKKTGLSTAASELEKLKDRHAIIPLITEYRELTKLVNTYLSTLPTMIDPKDKRIHTSFNQTVTATGRLSSSNPNLQNIPVRTKLGRTIRKGFIALKGYTLISADYSQIELRLGAILSKDPKMLKSFKAGEDIHSRTAAEVFGVPLEKVKPDQRRKAKEVNFGVLYGLGSTGLAQRTGMSRNEAKDFIARYFELYKGLKRFIETSKSFAHTHGYAETMFGRRRNLPEIHSSNPMLIAQAERMAVNMPLQGTAADLMKIAMINTKEKLTTLKNVRMLLQVHDELVFEVKDNDVKKIAPLIKKTMESIAKYPIPLVVDLKVGNNWAEMKEISP